MTKLSYEERKLNSFINFLNDNNISQIEAANLLDISKGQLTHLLKRERRLNPFIAERMGYIIEGKTPYKSGGIYGLYYDDKIIYIGQTKNFKNRISTHKTMLTNNAFDNQPFHNSNINLEKISSKILFNCEKKFMYLKELLRIEELLIRVILPEWNTNIQTLSTQHCSQEDKIQQLIDLHETHLHLLNTEIQEFSIPVEQEIYTLLGEADNYSAEEIRWRAEIIVSHMKPIPVIDHKARMKILNDKFREKYKEKYGEYPDFNLYNVE